VRLRPAVVLALLLAASAALAGCSGGKDGGPPSKADEFQDLDVRSTSTTGVLLGVVVDEAIRPVKDAQVTVSKPDGSDEAQATDAQGRFAYGNLLAGTYFVKVRHPQFAMAQTSAEVAAGVEDPPVVRVQLTRLFSQQPYAETIKFDGYIACAYSIAVGSTCANDYTRLVAGVVPGCEGGCLKDYNVSKTAGNVREFRFDLSGGWQSMVLEEYWEPTLGEPESHGTLNFILSYFNRTDTGHWWAQGDGPSPLRVQVDVGSDGPGAQNADDLIPPEGMKDLFVIFGAGDTDVAVNQPFSYFQTNFYYAIPPDGWSFVRGDPMPF
jgi:hypothetical protein